MATETFDMIIGNIRAGLTGDRAKDFAYLKEQMEVYKDHEYAKEIIRACSRLIYEILPEDKRQELNKLFGKDELGIKDTLEEAKYNLYKKEYAKAKKLMANLITKLEELDMFADDKVSCYFRFAEYFEQLMYINLFHPEKEVRRAEFPYDAIYLVYASALYELGEHKEAKEALKKAMRWNPVNCSLKLEYMENCKKLGEMDEFMSENLKAFNLAFKRSDVAHCYRNMAYYMSEIGDYRSAMVCLILSNQYEKDARIAQSEMYYVMSKGGDSVKDIKNADFEYAAAKYGVPLKLSQDVLGLAFQAGKLFSEKGDTDSARYLWKICYDLTEDGFIKDLLDGLDKDKMH